jgi:hypothetical protein
MRGGQGEKIAMAVFVGAALLDFGYATRALHERHEKKI